MVSKTEFRLWVMLWVAVVLTLGWTLAWATVNSMPPQLVELPWVQVAIGMAIAAWGGATATLQRYLSATYDTKAFHWRSEVIKDLFVSGTVGAGTYLAGWVQALSTATLGLVLLLAGFLGVRLLTVVSERFLKQLDRP